MRVQQAHRTAQRQCVQQESTATLEPGCVVIAALGMRVAQLGHSPLQCPCVPLVSSVSQDRQGACSVSVDTSVPATVPRPDRQQSTCVRTDSDVRQGQCPEQLCRAHEGTFVHRAQLMRPHARVQARWRSAQLGIDR